MELFNECYVHFMWEDSLEDKEGFFADNICELTDCVLGGNFHKGKVSKSFDSAYPFKDKNDNDWQFFYYDPNYEYKKAFSEGKLLQLSFNGTTWIDLESDWKIGDFDVVPADYRIKPEQDACVILKQVDGVPTLCWNFAKDERCECRHIYFQGTVKECCAYIDSHNKFAPVMKAWEDGKQIQFESLPGKWSNLVNPERSDKYAYRIKPEELKSRSMTYRELAEWLAKGNGQCKTYTVATTHLAYGFIDEKDNSELPEEYKIRRWNSNEWIEPTVDIYEQDCKKE